MEFFEPPAFTRYLPRYLDDEQYRILQQALAETPEPKLATWMSGTGGFHKVRWADARRGKGRRGGLRVIYYWFDCRDQIWLITIYDKSDAADLTPEQKRILKAALDIEKKSRRRR